MSRKEVVNAYREKNRIPVEDFLGSETTHSVRAFLRGRGTVAEFCGDVLDYIIIPLFCCLDCITARWGFSDRGSVLTVVTFFLL